MNFLCAIEIGNRNAVKIASLVSHDAKYHINKVLNVQRQFKNFIFDGLTEFQKLEIEMSVKRAAQRFERIISVDVETGEIKINTK